MKTYCVNLPGREEKWKLTLAECEKLGIDPIRFEAIKDHPGFEGCRKSHLKLLSEVKDEVFMIIEDDIQCCYEDPIPFINEAIDELPDDWDMLYLGATLNEQLERYSAHLFRLKNAYTTHAIIYNNRNGVVDFILENDGGGRKIDVFFAEKVQPKFNCFVTYPMIVTQRPGYSDVINREVDYAIIAEKYNSFTR